MSQKSQFAVAVVNEINEDVTAVTIGAGQTLSTVLTCGGTAPTGIILPSGFTASTLTFKISKTPNGTFLPITNFDGTSFGVGGSASVWIPLLPAMFNSVLYLQVETSVPQVSDVVLDFALAPIYQGVHS